MKRISKIWRNRDMEIRYNGEEIKLEDIVITWRDYKTGRFVSGDIEDYAEYKYNMGYETGINV